MANTDCEKALEELRAQWAKEKKGDFVAKPLKKGKEVNLMEWRCEIPAKKDTDWYGPKYVMRMEFSIDYPNKPPKCMFGANFFHPNVYQSGLICMSLLDEDKEWRPNTTIKEILEGIQNLLSWPDPTAPVQPAYDLYITDQAAYQARVRQQAANYTSSASS